MPLVRINRALGLQKMLCLFFGQSAIQRFELCIIASSNPLINRLLHMNRPTT